MLIFGLHRKSPGKIKRKTATAPVRLYTQDARAKYSEHDGDGDKLWRWPLHVSSDRPVAGFSTFPHFTLQSRNLPRLADWMLRAAWPILHRPLYGVRLEPFLLTLLTYRWVSLIFWDCKIHVAGSYVNGNVSVKQKTATYVQLLQINTRYQTECCYCWFLLFGINLSMNSLFILIAFQIVSKAEYIVMFNIMTTFKAPTVSLSPSHQQYPWPSSFEDPLSSSRQASWALVCYCL